MSLALPRKRTIIAWHRWLGIASAVFLLVVSITGLALNHTEWLKLDQAQIHNRFLLARYGMVGGNAITAYRIHDADTIAHLDGQLFYNGEPIISGSAPIQIIKGEPITVVATEDALIYFTSTGELIEKVGNSQLPYTRLTAVGTSPRGGPVLISDDRAWVPDENWLTFTPYEQSYTVFPMVEAELDASTEQQILAAFQGGGISLYRVLLDLHSGRLFGWGGRTLMDLSAVAIILLITSGIGGWLRQSRRQTKPHAR